MNTLPKSYHVWAESAEQLTIAITDFLQIFEEAHKFIYYDGRTWERGSLTIIPDQCAGQVCSMREYNLVKGE